MRRPTRVALWLLATPVVAVAWLWASVAVHYSNLPWPWSRTALAWTFFLAAPFALVVLGNRKRTAAVMCAAFAAIVAWHISITPSNDRDWLTELERIPDARFEGDLVHVSNIRNFDYQTESEFTVRYEDRTYDLSKLQGTDLFVSYWDGHTDIAHTLLSFDFGDDHCLCLSVEVRREKGEGWGGLPGMFKQFEIIYVLADERDVVRLRTNYRKEEVYCFRTAFTPQSSRLLLTDILEKVHRLNDEPEFYRTILNNCTTSLVKHVNAVWPGHIPMSKFVVMNGYAPDRAFERGFLKTDLPFDEYKASCYINGKAQAADDDPAFCRRIRE